MNQYIIIRQMNIIDKIKQTLSDPKQLAILVAGLGLLGFYGLYARKQIIDQNPKKKKRSTLDMSLQELIEGSKRPNILKIVITESSPMSYDFKSLIVTRLKQFLLSQQLNTLVNCAPLKLFHAGSEIFANTLRPEDPEDEQQYMSYFENALKCQLIIERTIIDIDQIKNKGKNTYILCDTNSLDLKARNELRLWNKFTQKYKIHEQQLKQNYNFVFHIEAFESKIPVDLLEKHFMHLKNDDNTDERITQAWRGFRNYHVIQYQPNLMMEENVEIALENIIERLKPILPPNVMYNKRRVFAREW